MSQSIGTSYENYICEKCGKKEVHHIEIWNEGNIFECSGCGYITDTRPKGEKIMGVIDNLKILDGYIEGDRFIMRGILGHAVFSTHSAEHLRSLGRLIDSKGEDFSMLIDEKTVWITKEQSQILRREYFALADEIEGAQ